MRSTLDRLRAAKKPGFLFGGGSARCIFQVGVVETLLSLGIRPAACLGVSGGAWNAAAVAVGNWRRLRFYWRCFVRWPYIDLLNLNLETRDLTEAKRRIRQLAEAFRKDGKRITENLDF